jgi:hypothetical protein
MDFLEMVGVILCFERQPVILAELAGSPFDAPAPWTGRHVRQYCAPVRFGTAPTH